MQLTCITELPCPHQKDMDGIGYCMKHEGDCEYQMLDLGGDMGNTIERLTIKDYGHYVPRKVCSINQYGEVDDQDSCPEYCEGVIGTCENGGCAIQECFDRLGVYEDLEEQGKLLKLPCAVGED